METSEQVRVTKALGTIAVVLGEDLSEERLEAYLMVLNDLPGGAVVRAIERLCQTARFFPKPAEIREIVEGASLEKAERAWVLFVDACHKSGDCSVYFRDNLLAHAMLDAFGGWIPAYETVVRLSPEMLASKRKEFVSAYMRHLKRPPVQQLRMHAGRHELANRENSGKWHEHWREIGVYPVTMLCVGDEIELIQCQANVENHSLQAQDLKRLGGGESLAAMS